MRWLAGLLVVGCIGLAATGCSRTEDNPSPSGTAPAGNDAGIGVQRVAGTTHASMKFDGEDRTYRLFIPFGLPDGAKVPLVVALHGGLGTGDQFAGVSKFEKLASDEGFIVVYPDGLDRTWNAGGCCGQAAKKKVDDVGFLAALIDALVREAPVDASRVFMTGHSNGGMMSFRFGCERPDVVKAVAPVAGSLETPTCKGSKGTNLLAIHGDSDQNHPIEGGEGPRSIAGVPFVSMEKSLDLWTSAMGCEADPEHSTAGAITSTVWTKCKDGTRASYMIVAGADHPWPGGPSGAQGTVASNAIDATTTVWAFFETVK